MKKLFICTRMRNYIIALILVMLVLGLLFNLNTNLIADAYNSSLNFDKTTVLEDLKSSTVNGKPFDVSEYPANPFGTVKIINFVEYCYTYRLNGQGNYALYVYLYNPKGINFDTESSLNFLQIAVGDDENVSYEKYNLKFISKTDGDLKNRFYKFKVIDAKNANGKKLLDKINVEPYKRVYRVSGIELVTYGEPLAEDYTIAGTYIFTGFVKGYGTDTTRDTLECAVKELETLRLDVQHTNFRPEVVSSAGKGHQNDLSSVYFAVPNEVLSNHGDLQKIKATWYEYRTAPIVVTRELDTYKYVLDNALGRIVKNNKGKYGQWLDQDITIAFSSCDAGVWSYNDRAQEVRTAKLLSYIFHRGYSDVPYEVSKTDLLDWIRAYEHSFVGGKVLNKYSADLFESGLSSDRAAIPYVGNDIHHKLVEIDARDEYNLLSYDVNHKWWDKFLDFGWLRTPETGVNYENISAIKQINADDIKSSDKQLISNNLLINERDVDTFKAYCNSAMNENLTPFLFRFAVTDYFATDLFTYTGDAGHDSLYPDGKDTAYMAQENVFLNFDIIELTFSKDGNFMVIPVVSDPIDIVSGITPPLNPDGLPYWVKLILLILGIILGLVLLSLILPYILPVIVWLIALPFKVIAALFKGIKNTVSSSKKRKEKRSNRNGGRSSKKSKQRRRK